MSPVGVPVGFRLDAATGQLLEAAVLMPGWDAPRAFTRTAGAVRWPAEVQLGRAVRAELPLNWPDGPLSDRRPPAALVGFHVAALAEAVGRAAAEASPADREAMAPVWLAGGSADLCHLLTASPAAGGLRLVDGRLPVSNWRTARKAACHLVRNPALSAKLADWAWGVDPVFDCLAAAEVGARLGVCRWLSLQTQVAS